MTAYFIAHVDVNDWEAFRAYEKGVLTSISPARAGC